MRSTVNLIYSCVTLAKNAPGKKANTKKYIVIYFSRSIPRNLDWHAENKFKSYLFRKKYVFKVIKDPENIINPC